MTCDRAMELLSARLDGALTEEETQELEAHLARCPACRALEGQLAVLQNSFEDMEEIPAPEGFARGVMDRIAARESGTRKVVPLFRRPQFRALAGLAACAVLCVGLYQGGAFQADQTLEIAAASDSAVMALPAEETAGPQAQDADASAAEMEKMLTQSACDLWALAEPEYYGFENEQYIRVCYGQTPQTPSACILGSVDSLNGYLAQFPEDDLTAVTTAYDSAYFDTGRLLAVVVEEPSGSNRHELQSLARETVTILRRLPEEGTCDMAAWLVLAEVDAMFEDGDVLTVRIAEV